MNCIRRRFVLLVVWATVTLVFSPAPVLRAENVLSDADKQASYCMEASFGFAQRLGKLLSIQRDKRGKIQALLSQSGISATDKDRGATVLKSLSDEITATEVDLARWSADLQIFMSYLKRRDRLEGTGNISNIQVTSAEVRKDQLSVTELYSSCVRLCDQTDLHCRRSCNDKANASDPNKRMLRCHEIINNFK